LENVFFLIKGNFHMNSLLKTSLLGLALVSTASMAELADFTGPEVGATLAISNGKLKTGGKSLSDTSAGVALHGGYVMEATKDIAVLFGIDYNLTNVKSGTGESDEEGRQKIYFKNPYSLSLGAGSLVNDNTLAYAKVSYESAKYSYGKTNSTLKGYGLGAGARYLLNKTTYVQAELKYTKYTKNDGENIDDANVSNTQFNIGLGMMFK
jgi:opacity protein-like surface antigen